jgi:hypothetical protein
VERRPRSGEREGMITDKVAVARAGGDGTVAAERRRAALQAMLWATAHVGLRRALRIAVFVGGGRMARSRRAVDDKWL